ncbi:Hsp70 family protein [Nocardia sp. NBC_00565]|uniref:Hsp70 family protein n=1 Tax=Nocardia sp. NBC_00565 TaxID=2975993 RepID=UPI002E81F9BD|nr:Hsp70 family protein [Nocardia sp. NBC_00565]WUC03122.1 Hsp70 family protein [Nocardia sp. NBC_00565]
MESMVLVLGVSAGAGGARAMLTHSDQPHLPPIDRCQVPRRAGGGVEEPVFEAIRQMRAAADRRDELITGTAVTCRCPLHADAIRATAGRTRLTIIDEPLAQLRYLRFTGRLPTSGSVILYDLGSSGLTITHADCRTDTILSSKRSTVLGGDGYDALLRWQLARGGVLTDKLTSRRHREELSSARVITAMDASSGGRAVITRSDLAELCAAGIHHSASFVRQLIEQTGIQPEALVLVGGCTRNPNIREELAEMIELPVVYDSEPEYVSARGAVLVAAERPSGDVRMARLRSGALTTGALVPTTVGRRKLIAAVAVTVALGATIAGILTMDRSAAQTPDGGNAPTPVEVAGIPPTPLN